MVGAGATKFLLNANGRISKSRSSCPLGFLFHGQPPMQTRTTWNSHVNSLSTTCTSNLLFGRRVENKCSLADGTKTCACDVKLTQLPKANVICTFLMETKRHRPESLRRNSNTAHFFSCFILQLI